VRRGLGLKVDLLASIALELIAVGTFDGGSSFLTQLTPDLIGINHGTGIGSSHHPGSEVVGGEILNPLQWNLTRRLALETHNGPAARGCYVQQMKRYQSSSSISIEMVMAALQLESASWSW